MPAPERPDLADTDRPSPEVGDAPGAAGSGPAGDGGAHAAAPGSATRRKKRGGMRSLVLSMLVLLAFLLAWSAFTPKLAPKPLPTVDAASSARTIVEQTHWPVRFASNPPEGWRPTSVAYGPTAQGPTAWRVGYHDATDERYVAVLQTKQAPGSQLGDWVTEATFGGSEDGTAQVGGTTWARRVAEGDPTRRALVYQDRTTQMTYVVAGPATYEDLQAFAARLTPYPGS